jgi:hypothetical protein
VANSEYYTLDITAAAASSNCNAAGIAIVLADEVRTSVATIAVSSAGDTIVGNGGALVAILPTTWCACNCASTCASASAYASIGVACACASACASV